MAHTFRKKPATVEAMRLTEHNGPEIQKWADKYGTRLVVGNFGLYVATLEGTMKAEFGDWIIKGVNNEFYPCKPNIFAATYEAGSDSD